MKPTKKSNAPNDINQRQSPSPRARGASSDNGSNSVTVWKMMSGFLLCIVVLFATDSIEIKKENKFITKKEVHLRTVADGAGDPNPTSPPANNSPTKNNNKNQGTTFTDEADTADTNDSSSKNNADDTDDNDDGTKNSNNGDDDYDNNNNDDDDGTNTDNGDDDNVGSDEPSTTSGEDKPLYTYTKRARELSQSETDSLVEKWGSWTLVDDKDRPTNDFYNDYPNRDVPSDEFPSNAWQKDKDYLGKFLKESKELVMRAMEAILAEYGHGTDDESSKSFEERAEMFELKMIDLGNGDIAPSRLKPSEKGGWTTSDSWEGLKRHLLHAIMSEDSFIFAMGGHSSAAGHGNHFQQSYTLQVQKILEPLLARLGVFHESRNFGNGGLGTAHNGMAASSIYGFDVDVLMWDSGMTEKGDMLPDMMARQAIIGGNKVPVLWSFPEKVLTALNQHADIAVGAHGTSMIGIPTANSYEDLENIAWAARYMICDNEIQKEFCKPYEYNGTCWIDRPDYTPTNKQEEVPGGRASWHPGNRYHQLIGRTLAFTILQALHEALVTWSEIDGYMLPDNAWHVTDYYSNMRTKAIDYTDGACQGMEKYGLQAVCNVPFKARTMFTPRAYPTLTSIRSILPKEMDELIKHTKKNVYDAPDVFIPHIHPDPGEVDVTGILELGVPFQPVHKPSVESFYRSTRQSATIIADGLKPGKGIIQSGRGADHLCDGTYNSFCDRNDENTCLLRAHNDGRNGFTTDGYSGWTIMNVPDVSHGLIALKFHTWTGPSPKTSSWKSINDEGEEGVVSKNMGKDIKLFGQDYCPEIKFEFMIDGKLTSWDSKQLEEERQLVQRVVEVFKVLDDTEYTNGGTKDVEVAYRIIGCGRKKSFSLTHIYWA